jgi:hypothetical protein
MTSVGLGGIYPAKGRFTMVLFHFDCSGWTSFHTEATLDAAGFFFENDGGQVDFLSFF